ncbi:MAG: glucose-6-phosphate isomerase, partial [Clostridia bacterium]|nr:glucose-6-phosphate isomerase [Clostridia bacterium]
MSIKINNKYIKQFITEEEINAIAPEVEAALETIKNKTGAGSDFLGWYTRPVDYDKEEYARIKLAAKKIQGMCEAFIVIG